MCLQLFRHFQNCWIMEIKETREIKNWIILFSSSIFRLFTAIKLPVVVVPRRKENLQGTFLFYFILTPKLERDWENRKIKLDFERRRKWFDITMYRYVIWFLKKKKWMACLVNFLLFFPSGGASWGNFLKWVWFMGFGMSAFLRVYYVINV